MIPNEIYRINDRIRAYILKIDPTSRQQQIILSRTCNEFLAELLRQVVPEFNEGLLEMKGVARIPGRRAKVAVQVKDKRIDPIAAASVFAALVFRAFLPNSSTNESTLSAGRISPLSS